MTLALAMALLAKAAMMPPRAVRPLGDATNWFTARDYPREAQVAREQGTTAFEVDIDPSGLPSDCRITHSSGSKPLDDRTCTVMMSRARFRPVTDRRGRAVPSVFRHAMRWKLPTRQQERSVDRSFDANSVVSATGEVVSCELTGAGASKIATAGGRCGPFGNAAFFQFFLKEDFRKVRAVKIRMSVAFDGAPAATLDRPPNVAKSLARSDIVISPAGDMTSCTSVAKLEALGRTLDLCDFIRADPPRYLKASRERRGSILLDLFAFYS